MKLVENWRQGWRWISVHCMWIAAAIVQTWAWMPPDLRAAFPEKWMLGIASAVLALGVAGRFVKQGKDDAIDHPDSH